jgi:hypothetical protein
MENAMQSIFFGGCHCGRIRYRIVGAPYHQTLCHCAICRRTSGAPAVAWFSVSTGAFEFLHGTVKHYRSSNAATRSFCGDCGTQLSFQSDGTSEVDVTTCSLDRPDDLPPQDQTFTRSRLAWMHDAYLLASHETTRP